MITYDGPIVMFDVDDTLVMWNMAPHPDVQLLTFKSGFVEPVVIHQGHIESLKQHKARGHKIFVWSAGGAAWAEEVVDLLGLRDYVDVVMGKPDWYYDDISASEFMPEHIRVYKETYKSRNRGHT